MEKYIKKLICSLIVITTIFASSISYTKLVKAEEQGTQESTDIIAYGFRNDETIEIKTVDNIQFYAQENYTIVLNQDIEISKPFYVQGNWTIKMNGHKIYRNLSSAVNNGEIFNINAYQTLNLLGIGDSRVPGSSDQVQNTEFTYYGYRKDDYTTDDTKSELTVTTGGLITGGNSTSTAGAIHMHYASTLNLDNVAVNGNAAEVWDKVSGAIYLDTKNDNVDSGNYTITMNNSHIDHNLSNSSGGGIYIDESDATTYLEMVNSTIDYNISRYHSFSGGGIAAFSPLKLNTNQGDTFDYNSSISHNYAQFMGGGIYLAASSKGSEIKKVKINNNYAGNPGGGIYLNANSASLDDCEISGNTCKGNGGGIYINNKNVVQQKNFL